MRLVSFDIFDTTLLRLCGKPENVFYILSQKLFPDNQEKRKIFLSWRLEAENKVVGKYGNSTSIHNIYENDDLPILCGIPTEKIIQTELEVEKEMLKPYPHIADLIQKYKADGYIISFISDMYLPSSYLKNILKSFGLFEKDDYIFISNEHNARKSDGTLYKLVKEELKPTQWIHYGDNAYSDVKMAKKNGIHAHWVKTGFSITEARLSKDTARFACGFETSILAGITRFSRLQSNNPYDIFASHFVAPTYIPYIIYLKNQLLSRKCKRAYFLSRDSYIFMKMFEMYHLSDIEPHYFFVSRKSLLLPFYNIAKNDAFLKAFPDFTLIGNNVNDILHSLRISDDDLVKHNIKFTFSEIKNKDDEKLMLKTLFDSELTPILDSKAKKEYDLFVDYLNQERVTEDDTSVMIDVGWVGTTRLMINQILKSIGKPSVHFIYYSVNNNVLPYKYGAYSYFREGSADMFAFFELYFSECPYKSTIGYTNNGGNIIPLFTGNGEYKETEILLSNKRVLTATMQNMAALCFKTNDALSYWAHYTEQSLLNCWEDIDYGVLTSIQKYKKGEVLAGHLNLKESIRYLLGYKICSIYEFHSSIMTFGFKFAHFYLPVNKFLFKLKSKISWRSLKLPWQSSLA